MTILNISALVALSAKYVYDSSVNFSPEREFTTDGYELVYNRFDIKGIESSDYSYLFLTKQQQLSSLYNLNIPAPELNLFLTTLQTYDNQYAQFLVNTITTVSSLNQYCIFEIEFLDAFQARIRYNDQGTLKFLTEDINTGFFIFTNTVSADLQNFYYFFDAPNQQISFFIIKNNIPYAISKYGSTLQLTSNNIPSIKNILTTRNNFLKISPPLQNTWVSYLTGVETNTSDIQHNRSIVNLKNNFLGISNLNDIDIENGSYNIQFVPLKNQVTSDNLVNRGNVFDTKESDVTQRIYNSISLEEDDIMLGYSCGVKSITFTKDQLTYFRFPYVSSPYINLNINDTSLVKLGAIGGDLPINADKVFKQREPDYKDFTITDEQNGTWLCAWLSASPTAGTPPIWVDRYYNPNFVNFANALNYNAPFYIDEAASIIIDNNLQNQIIFDLPSRLLFEPHCLYAYHHIGNTDLVALINTKTDQLVVSSADIYQTLNSNINLLPNTDNLGADIYTFNEGINYILFNPLTINGSFTLTFFLYTDNYQTNFAQSIFTNSRINIFNDTSILTAQIDQFVLTYSLSCLKFGWHNVSLVFNNEQGYAKMYIDSFEVDILNFNLGEYTFTNLFTQPLTGGLLAQNLSLKGIQIYNTALSHFDIRNIAFVYSNIRDLQWNIPTGQRQFIDSIERFFKFRQPYRKSNTYNIVIQNSGVIDSKVQQAIENQINNLLPEMSPVYTQLNSIIWKEN